MFHAILVRTLSVSRPDSFPAEKLKEIMKFYGDIRAEENRQREEEWKKRQEESRQQETPQQEEEGEGS